MSQHIRSFIEKWLPSFAKLLPDPESQKNQKTEAQTGSRLEQFKKILEDKKQEAEKTLESLRDAILWQETGEIGKTIKFLRSKIKELEEIGKTVLNQYSGRELEHKIRQIVHHYKKIIDRILQEKSKVEKKETTPPPNNKTDSE